MQIVERKRPHVPPRRHQRDAFVLHHDQTFEKSVRPLCGQPLPHHRLFGFESLKVGVLPLAEDPDNAQHISRPIYKSAAAKAVEPRRQQTFGQVHRPRPQIRTKNPAAKGIVIRFELFQRLQKNPRVQTEKVANPGQHVGPGKTLARQIAVELRAVDGQLTRQVRDGRISVRQCPQIGAKDAAQLTGRARIRPQISILGFAQLRWVEPTQKHLIQILHPIRCGPDANSVQE